MQQYRHTQFGTVIVVGLALGIVVEAGVFWVLRDSENVETMLFWIIAPITLVLAACTLLFYKLTVEVTAEHLKFAFGAGLIRKTIPLADTSACTPVRNRLWHGWGIHYIGAGWLYNVSGLDAVEVLLKSGKRLRIGTDQPGSLAGALTKAIAIDR